LPHNKKGGGTTVCEWYQTHSLQDSRGSADDLENRALRYAERLRDRYNRRLEERAHLRGGREKRVTTPGCPA